MIKFIDVFDCDGVLLSSAHRYRTMPCNTRIDLEHWHKNSTPEKIWKDEPLPMARYYRECLADPEHYVIIATARVCQQADYDSIAFKLGKPQKFICREKGDHQSGVTLKLAGLKRLLNLKQFKNAVWTIYEDNLAYLDGIADELGANKVFVPSVQGH
ncbi:MAG: hypothetical protein GY928_24745 [Colwellia sp.]|nr:hypothetical protein [Colwellia sp.]